MENLPSPARASPPAANDPVSLERLDVVTPPPTQLQEEGEEEEDDPPPPPATTASSSAAPTGPVPATATTTYTLPVLPSYHNTRALRELRALPVLRSVAYRPSRGFSGLGRAINYEATVGTCVGSIAPVAYAYYLKQSRIFVKCIVVVDCFHSAYTNYYFNLEGI